MRTTKPPLLLRFTSGRLRASAFHRIYRSRAADKRWRGLFQDAPLNFAPGVKVTLLPTDFIHAEIAFTGEYEQLLSRLVVELGAAGGSFVDVGANIGYFSLLWAARHPGNTVHAFEASPRNLPLLAHNVRANKFTDRIMIYDCALSRETGFATFDLGPEGVSGWGGLSLDASGPSAIHVPATRLDDILPSAAIDFLKIDVEGADTWVLMGARELLRARRIKRICFEQNKPRMKMLGIQEDAAQSFLRSVGYSACAVSDISQGTVGWMAMPA